MAIWLTENSKVIVQGMTGSEGTKHTARCCAAGTNVVGGVNARKAGQRSRTRARTCRCSAPSPRRWPQTGADVSVVFVPPKFTKDAVIEAIDAEIPLCVVITEGIPVHDTHHVLGARGGQGQQDPHHRARTAPASPRPASPTPASSRPTSPRPAASGWCRKSGTLTYQMMYELRDIGFSTCVGIGGDPVIGTTHIDALQAFQDDPETDAIVMIGEIGGDAEERAAAYIEQHVTKPVVGYVAGFTAPEGKTMGHAGAIVSGSSGTAQAKKEALEKVGVRVGKTPSETARLMREIMSR